MPILCPECHAQYREGVLRCSDCHVELIVISDSDYRRGHYEYMGDADVREASRFKKRAVIVMAYLFIQLLSLFYLRINIIQVLLDVVGAILLVIAGFKFVREYLTKRNASRNGSYSE
jgi:hypothetical protein